MHSLYSIFPDGALLIELEPEEIGGIILEYLNHFDDSSKTLLNRYNFSLHHTYKEYPQELHQRISQVLMEGWVWLENEGMLVPTPGQQGEWMFISRKGERIRKASDITAYKNSSLLPKKLLHPIILQKTWGMFVRGEYETAVFQSFKEVEVAVRSASGFKNEDIGTNLMRKAFEVEEGALTNKSLPKAEREAMSNLFAGAIGCYKNPHSHRTVEIKAEEAVELILLANHLINLVDTRKSNF